ncbi:MAG: N-acetylneuraminate synthase [Kiritimatiellae bacterium]|nr:N-acetylneuraminate synthase [Kiritimatiellia bacterium]
MAVVLSMEEAWQIPGRCFIIAEAGVNHNGSLERALELVDAAAAAGADAVKFQTFVAEEEISRFAPKAEYQLASTPSAESQMEMVKKLELNREQHEALLRRCRQKNIMFLSSPFDLKSIQMLLDLDVAGIKIPSGEITNLPYLRAIGRSGKPVIMSTGMATTGEIGDALKVLEKSGTLRDRVMMLHCNTEYPTPMKDVNLRAMLTLRDTFGVRIGYSDHTLGTEVSVAAVALGAAMIEKHLTLDCGLPGPDHKASMEPRPFREMVQAIRNVEQSLGSGEKTPSPSERKNLAIARKSIVASRDIAAGERFTEENITAKRPGTGISPMKWDEVIGRTAKRAYQTDEMIEL